MPTATGGYESDLTVAIATGSKSGVWVFDIDADKGGEASLKDIETRMGALPATVESITTGGGRHLFFRIPDFDGAPEIKNSVSKVAPGIDVRGVGVDRAADTYPELNGGVGVPGVPVD